MADDLITLKEARLYLGFPDQDSEDALLSAVIAGVSQAIRQDCTRHFTTRQYSEVINGRGVRAIFARDAPVAASPAPAVSENGVALAVAAGYSNSADVSVNLEEGIFYRLPGSSAVSARVPIQVGVWSEGINNVQLVYTAGVDVADVPPDLKLAVKYAVGMAWKHADRKEIGVKSRSDGQRNVDFLDDLPAIYKAIIGNYARPFLRDV